MKVFEKILLITAVLILAISCFAVCFAEEDGEGEDVQVITNYDDYQQLLEESAEGSYITSDYDDYNYGGTSSSEDTSDSMKEYSLEYQDYIVDYYNNYSREKAVRAIVIEAGIAREEYGAQDYYTVTKSIYQDVKVKLLEGDHKGEELNIDYLLSADSLNNIILAQLHVGDKVFVVVTEESDGTITGDISNSWATVDRTSLIVCMGAIVVILLLIYAGKAGLKAVFITAMIILSCVVIVPSFTYLGNGPTLVAVICSLAIVCAICIAHLGIRSETLKAICISTFMCAILLLILLGILYVGRMVGVSFEFAAISENAILKNFSFTALFYMITLLVGAGVIANTVCQCISRIERECANNFNDRADACKKVILSNVVITAIILLATYIPNQLLLLLNKFTDSEIMNSETFICEIIRVFAIQIVVILCAPVVSLDNFKFGNKYLTSAENKKEE